VKSLRWCLGCLAAVVLLAALSGCKREDKVVGPPPPDPTALVLPGGVQLAPPLEETGPHAAGKKVYNAQACARCHSMGKAAPGDPVKGGPAMGGPGKGGPKAKGPDLAKAGAKEGRTVDWFVAYVSNPKKDNPDAKMPAFENKIKADDMRALAEFLASLK
jgi:mono/diheme cytochrome c family protein